MAIGIALDIVYLTLVGMLSKRECEDILELLEELGFVLYVPELSISADATPHTLLMINGLIEFRGRLGGQLTIMLLSGIGTEVHYIDEKLMARTVSLLRERQVQDSSQLRSSTPKCRA